MLPEVFITCAVTGIGSGVERSPYVPVTPEQIADSTIATARAGAAAVHIHVRDGSNRRGSRAPALYREAVKRIRNSDLMINLITGMGSDLVRCGVNVPYRSTLRKSGALERFVHVDLHGTAGSLRLATRNEYLMFNTLGSVRAMVARVQEPGVRPGA